MKVPSKRLLQVLRSTEFGSTARHSGLNPPIRQYGSSRHPLPVRHRQRASIATQLPRYFSTVACRQAIAANKSKTDRGPVSKEDTQTDFGTMNVLGNTAVPATSIDACLSDGFHLDNGLKISGGSGCLLVAGEAFIWRPWEAGIRSKGTGRGKMINRKGQWDVENEAWGVLDVMWPKPGTYTVCF